MAVTALIDTLVLEHDGYPEELTYSWDNTTNILTLGGFRQADGVITYIDVTFTLLATPTVEITSRLYVTEIMDSNDIKDTILAYLVGVITGLGVEVISETPARAVVDWDMEFCWADFAADGPVLSVLDDGTCDFSITSTTSADVALAAVNGIAAARGRLVAWDRENAIYRSGILDMFDFLPSLATQAAVGKSAAVRGNIIFIAAIADGYVVYSTDNIVRASYTGDEYVFKYSELHNYGIAAPLQIYVGANNHALLSAGSLYIFTPANGSFQAVSPGLDNHLQQQVWPVRVLLINDRYLCLCLPQLTRLEREARRHRGMQLRPLLYVPNLDARQTVRNEGPLAIPYQTYDRILVLDIKLSKWGSCDVGAKLLFGTTFVNASGLRLDKSILNIAMEPLSGYTQGMGIVMPDGAIGFATPGKTDSFLVIGHTKIATKGLTAFTEIRTEMVSPGSYKFKLEPFDVDGSLLTAQIYESALQSAIRYEDYPDVVASYGDLTLSGAFHVKDLELVLQPNGLF